MRKHPSATNLFKQTPRLIAFLFVALDVDIFRQPKKLTLWVRLRYIFLFSLLCLCFESSWLPSFVTRSSFRPHFLRQCVSPEQFAYLSSQKVKTPEHVAGRHRFWHIENTIKQLVGDKLFDWQKADEFISFNLFDVVNVMFGVTKSARQNDNHHRYSIE